MLREDALEPGICAAAGGRVADLPVFDESTFDRDYFTSVSNYAGRYDRSNPPHKIAGYLREIRRLRPAGSLLDVGPAFGRFLEAAQEHYECEGVDISAYATRLARERLPGVPIQQCALQAFLPGRTYDIVTCFDVLEHIPDLDAALNRLRGLVAPAGLLALAVPVYDSPAGWVCGLVDHDPTHIHRLGRLEWIRRLKQAGLEPIVFKGILRVPLPGLFLHAMSPALRWCSSAIFVICAQGGLDTR